MKLPPIDAARLLKNMKKNLKPTPKRQTKEKKDQKAFKKPATNFARRDHMKKTKSTLPPGWEVITKIRKTGKSAGIRDSYYISPSGQTARSKAEIQRIINGEV